MTARARPAATRIGVLVSALVAPELFVAAQERLARNQRWSPRSTRGDDLLRRRVSCRRCGAPAWVSDNGRSADYRCTTPGTVAGAGGATRCQAHAVPTADRDAAILAEAVQRARDGWLDESARAARQHDLRTRVGTLERRRQRHIDAYAAEAVTLEELRTRVQALEARLADRTHEEQQLIASVDHAAQIAAVATQLDTCRVAVAQGLDHASFARRRELVELLIHRVLVEPPEVEIRYVIPFGGAAHRKVDLRLRHPVPFIPRTRSATAQPVRVSLTEFAGPLSDRLVGDDHPALGQQLLHIPIAAREAIVELHGVGDALRGKARPSVGRGRNNFFHAASIACRRPSPSS